MERPTLMKKGEHTSSESASETTSEHGEQEVRMSLQQLHSVCEAATKLKGHVKKETLVPAWVQSLLTVAHENLEHIEGYFEGKHMKKGGDFVMPTSESHKPRMPVPTRGMKKPPAPSKGGTAARNIALSETAQETDVEKVNKSDAPVLPQFPRVTGDSRVLLQHVAPDQTVIQQITGRDTHQPHSYNLAPSNWEDGFGLRRR
jgi:hypothetical protein